MEQVLTNQIVNKLATKNQDMKQRRCVNAAASVDSNDYIIQSELINAIDNLTGGFDDAASKAILSSQPSISASMIKVGTHASRLSGVFKSNTFYYETDRTVLYMYANKTWYYISGVMSALLSGKPTDLGTVDIGFKFCPTDYNHVLMWNGTGWAWGPGESGGAYFGHFAVPPLTNGWHLCDGSSVNYLKGDSTTAAITLPNAAATPFYMKGGNSYNATINAANGLTGSHVLTVAEMPSHQHGLTQLSYNTNYTATSNIVAVNAGATPLTQQTDLTGGGGGHTHNLTGDLVTNIAVYLYFRL